MGECLFFIIIIPPPPPALAGGDPGGGGPQAGAAPFSLEHPPRRHLIWGWDRLGGATTLAHTRGRSPGQAQFSRLNPWWGSCLVREGYLSPVGGDTAAEMALKAQRSLVCA